MAEWALNDHKVGIGIDSAKKEEFTRKVMASQNIDNNDIF
jgi:hypothetical protein